MSRATYFGGKYFGLIGLLCCATYLPALAVDPSTALEKPVSAPLFAAALFDLNNLPTSLVAFRGKPLIVNFWARWCGPCKVEIPELISLKARNTGIEVIGLNVESNAAAVREFAYAYDINYPVFLTREVGLTLMQALGNAKMVLPYTLVINRQGVVMSTHIGIMTREKLDAAVTLAL